MRRTVNGSTFQLVGVNRCVVPAFTHDVSSMPPLHQTNIVTYGEHDTVPSKRGPAQGSCLERNTLPDLRHGTDDALDTSRAHLDTQIYESGAYRNAPFRARQHELITGWVCQGRRFSCNATLREVLRVRLAVINLIQKRDVPMRQTATYHRGSGQGRQIHSAGWESDRRHNRLSSCRQPADPAFNRLNTGM